MLWYGPLYVTFGQFVWLNALNRASPVAISVGTTALFPLTVAWAMALLSSFPTSAQYVGSAVLLCAIASVVAKELRQAAAHAGDGTAALLPHRRSGSGHSGGSSQGRGGAAGSLRVSRSSAGVFAGV